MSTMSENIIANVSTEEIQTVKREKYQNLKAICVNVTLFQFEQIRALCKRGIAKNPTAFGRNAILDLLKENKHFLPVKFLPAKEKRKGVKDRQIAEKRERLKARQRDKQRNK